MRGQPLTLLRSYLDMRERVQSRSAARALLEAAVADHLSAATVFRGDIGLGRSRIVRAYMSEVQLDSLPLLVQVADTRERIERFVDSRAELFSGHLTTLENIWVVHLAGQQLQPELVDELPAGRPQCLLRVFFNDDLVVEGESFASAVADQLGERVMATMVLTAVEGFGAHRQLHRGTVFHPDRGLPVMMSILCGDPESADAALSAVLALSTGVTVTAESVSLSVNV